MYALYYCTVTNGRFSIEWIALKTSATENIIAYARGVRSFLDGHVRLTAQSHLGSNHTFVTLTPYQVETYATDTQVQSWLTLTFEVTVLHTIHSPVSTTRPE